VQRQCQRRLLPPFAWARHAALCHRACRRRPLYVISHIPPRDLKAKCRTVCVAAGGSGYDRKITSVDDLRAHVESIQQLKPMEPWVFELLDYLSGEPAETATYSDSQPCASAFVKTSFLPEKLISPLSCNAPRQVCATFDEPAKQLRRGWRRALAAQPCERAGPGQIGS
jgi:hypothetical protein